VRRRSRVARPSLRVDRWSVPATARRDGWSPNGLPRGTREQDPAYRPAHPPQSRVTRPGGPGLLRVGLVRCHPKHMANRADGFAHRHLNALARPVRRRTVLPGQHRECPTALWALGHEEFPAGHRYRVFPAAVAVNNGASG
jgi:hypothetical protein